MDLISAAVGLQQAKVTSEIQIRVARKMLDMQSQQGSAAIELIDAADAGFSKASNAMISAANALGGQVDLHA